MRRELFEELRFEPDDLESFGSMQFEMKVFGAKPVLRHYFLVAASATEADAFVLGEGREIGSFTGLQVLSVPRLVPYDAFALFLHTSRQRFAPAGVE